MHNPCEYGNKYLCRECLAQILESSKIRKCVGHAILHLSLALKPTILYAYAERASRAVSSSLNEGKLEFSAK